MKLTVIEPGFQILSPLDGVIELIERAGRTCYKSEERITPTSSEAFVRGIRKSKHFSVLEHASISVLIIGDRSMSHQLVRHRIAAYSQESQRYCDYSRKGFQVVCPPTIGVPSGEYSSCPYPRLIGNLSIIQFQWLRNRFANYAEYLQLLEDKIPPEDARSCLPNATKTEVVSTYNLRQWRHVFEERALNSHAQWQIKGIMQGILREFAAQLPCVFEDQLEALNAANI